MAVTSVKLRRTRSSGQKRAERTLTHVYVVVCSSVDDGPLVAENHASIPLLSSVYSVSEPDLIVDSKSTDTIGESGTVFEVTVNWKTIDPSQSGSATSREKTVEFIPTEFVEDAYEALEAPEAEDADGTAIDISSSWKWKNAVVNSAGVAFDPSVAKPFYDQTMVITRNVELFDWALANAYQDTVNSDTFTVTYQSVSYEFDPGQARISFYGALGRFEDGDAYFEERIEIQIREDGWVRKVLDQGTMELNNGDTPPKPIRDAEGNPVRTAVMLDGLGAQLDNDANPVFLKFKLFKDEMPFGSLDLNS